MAEEKRKRILSGIQPTGTPTLGNYIGAVRNWALLQSDYDCLGLHAEHLEIGGRDEAHEAITDQRVLPERGVLIRSPVMEMHAGGETD